MLGEILIFYNTDYQNKFLRPACIERDKKDKRTNLTEEMFIFTWKCPFLNDDLASLSTGAIPSGDMAEDLFTVYQKGKAAYIQYIEERLS